MVETPGLEQYREAVMGYNMYDKEYVALVFSGRHKVSLSQFVLRMILERDDVKVRNAHVEHDVPNLLGRGIRMDVMAVAKSSSTFDLEFQRNVYGASPQRARFNASVIDANYDLKGVDPRELHLHLPETYVIFITETDVFGKGWPIYRVERVFVKDGTPFNDGSHIIYVNGAYDGIDTPIGKLIHDFRCTRADDMLLPQLAERTRELKETKRGAQEMSERWEKFLEDMQEDMRTEFYDAGRKEGIKQGIKQGRQEGKKEGKKQGKKEGVLTTLFGLVTDGLLPPSIAATRASMSEALFMEKMAKYQGA